MAKHICRHGEGQHLSCLTVPDFSQLGRHQGVISESTVILYIKKFLRVSRLGTPISGNQIQCSRDCM
jgi:hypothetical protein